LRHPDKVKLKETILALRTAGWSYRQIEREVALHFTGSGRSCGVMMASEIYAMTWSCNPPLIGFLKQELAKLAVMAGESCCQWDAGRGVCWRASCLNALDMPPLIYGIAYQK
jgi:hypothetical protein